MMTVFDKNSNLIAANCNLILNAPSKANRSSGIDQNDFDRIHRFQDERFNSLDDRKALKTKLLIFQSKVTDGKRLKRIWVWFQQNSAPANLRCAENSEDESHEDPISSSIDTKQINGSREIRPGPGERHKW